MKGPAITAERVALFFPWVEDYPSFFSAEYYVSGIQRKNLHLFLMPVK